MTGNRLIDRRAAGDDAAGISNRSPVGYDDPYAWCAWRNSEKTRADIMWIVGPQGTPILVDDEAVCAELHRKDRLLKEAEARRHNHRIMHPITERCDA